MKIAVVGPGGVGGYFGGLLARAGFDVWFIGRGGHLEAMKERGLRVESFKGDFEVAVNATDDPEEAGICDLVLFCVKSFDTEAAAEGIRPLVGPSTVIISLQNGLGNEETLGALLGSEKIMGGVSFVGSRIIRPGVILHTAAGSIAFGELEGGMSERGKVILKLFEEASIEARITENIKKMMWQKMVWNCGFNALTALTGCTVAEVLSLDETKRVVEAAMDEVVSVARGAGVELGEDLPRKTIASTRKQGEIRTSMLIDMERGCRMEIAPLNGAVSKTGHRMGIPTPVNDTLYGMIMLVNRSRGYTDQPCSS